MNIRKLIVKIVYGLDAVLIIVLVGFLIYQHRLIRQMSDNEQTVPPAGGISNSNTLAENNTQTIPMATYTRPMVKGGVEQLAAKIETLRYQLEAAEEELEMAREDLANKKGPDEDWQEYLQKMIAWEKKARENPTLMKAKRRAVENEIVNGYREFFERLGVPDEKLQDIKAVMVDNEIEMEYLEFFAGGRLPPWTDEDGQEIQQQIEDQATGFETQMKKLLGAENYEIYDHYVETGLERSQSAGLGLSDEKTQELIDAMYVARKAVEAKYEGFDATWLDPNSVEQIYWHLETYDAYMENARRILSESQAAQFEARMNENKESMKFYLPSMGDGDNKSL